MHELAITQSMFDIVLREAEQAEASQVRKVNLVIGEMTGVVDQCVRFYFDLLSRGTIAEGADLCVRMVPPRARCRNCAEVFELRPFRWTCPRCQGTELEVIAGRELFVESIEVE